MSESHPPPIIRAAEIDDLAVMVDLLVHGSLVTNKEDPSALDLYESALLEIQATKDCQLLVAEADSRVVGVCQLIIFRHFQARGGRCAEIESLHVHPDYRSQGIGGLLLEEAVARARNAGCYRVQLTSNQIRSDAHRFYLRHGFEPSHHGFKRQFGDDRGPVRES